MVEFTGPLTDKAEDAFIRIQKRIGLIILLLASLFTLPNIFLIGKFVLQDDAFIYAMLTALLVCAIVVLIPKGKKEFVSTLPLKVYVDKRHIVCDSERHSESRLISDVKKVIDHGEYYELYFAFGKGSNHFICQKNLLTKGSLAEFESLFDGKIIKKTEL